MGEEMTETLTDPEIKKLAKLGEKISMTTKKYKLTDESIEVLGVKLFRIVSLTEFGNIKKGEKGGFIEKETNLEHDGDAWVYGDARVSVRADFSAKIKTSCEIPRLSFTDDKSFQEYLKAIQKWVKK